MRCLAGAADGEKGCGEEGSCRDGHEFDGMAESALSGGRGGGGIVAALGAALGVEVRRDHCDEATGDGARGKVEGTCGQGWQSLGYLRHSFRRGHLARTFSPQVEGWK